MMRADYRNILVIEFGQLGDVVLSLPALHALRTRYPSARITALVGKPGRSIIELAGFIDDCIPVDRVALRDGPRGWALRQLVALATDVRRRRFDLVIDLQSLQETNLLGWASGAPARLFGRRPRRSLDFLSNVRPRPPIDTENRHITDRLLDVVRVLGCDGPNTYPLQPRVADRVPFDAALARAGYQPGTPLVGFFCGAGDPRRRWPMERFAALAHRLDRECGVRVAVFTGPEEEAVHDPVALGFPATTILADMLPMPQFAAAAQRVTVLVSNDTGPMHVTAAVGTPVVALLGRVDWEIYVPIGAQHRTVRGVGMANVPVDAVFEATRASLAEAAARGVRA